MFSRADRRELAVLGLVALSWCLLVAPVLHRETHAAGRKHSHGLPSQQRSHGEGSFEHQLAVFVAPPASPVVLGSFGALALLVLDPPLAPLGERRRSVAQARAP